MRKQLEKGDIYPTIVRTDSDGVARFWVSTAKDLLEPITTNIKIKVLKDKANFIIPVQFIPDNFGLWVTESVPERNTEQAEVDKPFIITFNNSIKLIEDVSKIIITPEHGSAGNPQTIIDVYEGELDNNWIVEGHSLEWIHPRLVTNLYYTAEIIGVQDFENNECFHYTWRFKSTDTTPPELLAFQPAPWAVQVDTNSELRLQFTEPLMVDSMNYPVGLEVNLQPFGSVSFNMYDGEVVVFFFNDLQPDTTYTITVSGARDFADLVMNPIIWNFSTVAQPNSSPKVINLELNKDISGDVKTNTDIKIYLNKSLRTIPKPEIIVSNMDTQTNVPGLTEFITSIEEKAGLVFLPEQNFNYDTLYKIELVNVCDEEGRSLEGWSEEFLTEVQVSGTQSIIAGREQYTLTVPQPSGEEVSLNIVVPEGTLSIGTTIQAKNIHTIEKKELANKAYFKQISVTPAIYEVQAYEQEELITERFNEDLYIEISYTENTSGFVSDLFGNLITEQSLKVFFWNAPTQEWLPLMSTVNTDKNTVSFKINTFGVFGLLGEIGQATARLSEVKLTANPIDPRSNGFRNETTFKFRLAYDSEVTLTLYDRRGRMVAILLDGELYSQGYNGYTWDGRINGRLLRPGIYFYRLSVRCIEQNNTDVDWSSGVLGIKY